MTGKSHIPTALLTLGAQCVHDVKQAADWEMGRRHGWAGVQGSSRCTQAQSCIPSRPHLFSMAAKRESISCGGGEGRWEAAAAEETAGRKPCATHSPRHQPSPRAGPSGCPACCLPPPAAPTACTTPRPAAAAGAARGKGDTADQSKGLQGRYRGNHSLVCQDPSTHLEHAVADGVAARLRLHSRRHVFSAVGSVCAVAICAVAAAQCCGVARLVFLLFLLLLLPLCCRRLRLWLAAPLLLAGVAACCIRRARWVVSLAHCRLLTLHALPLLALALALLLALLLRPLLVLLLLLVLPQAVLLLPLALWGGGGGKRVAARLWCRGMPVDDGSHGRCSFRLAWRTSLSLLTYAGAGGSAAPCRRRSAAGRSTNTVVKRSVGARLRRKDRRAGRRIVWAQFGCGSWRLRCSLRALMTRDERCKCRERGREVRCHAPRHPMRVPPPRRTRRRRASCTTLPLQLFLRLFSCCGISLDILRGSSAAG